MRVLIEKAEIIIVHTEDLGLKSLNSKAKFNEHTSVTK